MGAVEKALGEEIGQEYVAVHFPPSHKEKMLVLVGNLLEAYRESIESLDWMTEATRQKALESGATSPHWSWCPVTCSRTCAVPVRLMLTG